MSCKPTYKGKRYSSLKELYKANGIYDAMGFEQGDFKQTFKNSLWRGQEGQPYINENGDLVLIPTYDTLFKSEGVSFTENLSMAQDFGERYSKNPFIVEINEDYANTIYPLDKKGRSQDYGKRVVGDEMEQRFVSKENIIIPKGKFKIHRKELNVDLTDVKTNVLLRKYQEQFTEGDVAEHLRYGEIGRGYATEDPLVFQKTEEELLKRGITKEDLPFLVQNQLNGLEYNVAEALNITKEFTDNSTGKKINLPDDTSVTQKHIDFYLNKVKEVEGKLENKGTKNEISFEQTAQITQQQKQEAISKFQEYVNQTGKQDIQGFKEFLGGSVMSKEASSTKKEFKFTNLKEGKNKSAKNPRGNSARFSISGIPMKTINEVKAQAWLQKKLGVSANMVTDINEFPITEQVIQDLIELRKKGLFVNGLFTNAGIYLMRGGRIGTEYHEAFHAVWKILDPKNKTRILAQAASEMEGNPSDIQIEEYLADKFREYVLEKDNKEVETSLPSAIKALFKRLYTLLKNIISNPKLNIDSLFENIELGVYKGKIKFERNVSNYVRTSVDNIFDSEMEKERRYSMLRKIVSHVVTKISQEESLPESEILKKYSLDDIHFKVFENLRTEHEINEYDFEEGDISEKEFNYRTDKLQKLISGIFEFEENNINRFTPAFEKDFTRYLKANYIQFKGKKEEDILGNKKKKEETKEEEQIKDQEETLEENPVSYDDQNFEVNPESKLNDEIRRFISNIPKHTYLNNKLLQETDDLGFPLFYSPSYVYSQLIGQIANTFSGIEEMMDKLKGTNNPMFETIYNKLENNEFMKRNVFKNIAAMNNVPSVAVQFKRGQIKVFNENRRNIKEVAKNTIIANFSMLNQIKTKEDAQKVKQNFEKNLKELQEDLVKTVSIEKFEEIKEAFYEAGLLLPPNFYNETKIEYNLIKGTKNYQKVETKKNKELADLLKSYIIALNKFITIDATLTLGEEARKLAEMLIPYYSQEIRTGYIGMNGNPRFGHHMPNFMSKLISLLNSPSTKVEERARLKRDPLLSVNTLLEERSNYSYELFGGLKDQGERVEYSELTPLQLELSKISLANRGKFVTTIFADKGSAAIISFKKRNLFEIISKLEEYRSAEKIRTKTFQEFVKKNPKDKRVPYLKELLSKKQDLIVPSEGLISDYLREEFETYTSYLKSVGLGISGQVKGDKGNLKSETILDNRIKNQFPDKDSLYEIFANQFLMNIESFVLTSGDPIHYKNNGDIQKRNAQVNSPKDYNIDQSTYNVIYIKDVQEASIEDFLSNIPEKLRHFFSKNEITDGFTWISPWRYKVIVDSQNKWTPKMEKIFQEKILTSLPLSVDEVSMFPPLKPHMYTLQWDETLQVMIPTQHKNSEQMLHVGLTKDNPTLNKIYELMRDKKLDAAMFNSAVKVGNEYSVDNIEEVIDDSYYHSMKNTDYGIQQQTDAHFLDSSVIFSSQLRSHFPTFINPEKTYKIGNNETVTGAKLLEEYLDIINNKVKSSSEEFFSEALSNPKEFLKRADRELTEVREQEIDNLPLGFPSVAAKNEMTFNTNFNKQVGRQKISGGTFVNMSAHKVSHELEIKFENGTFYVEAYLPRWTKNFFFKNGEEIDIKDIPSEALDLIGLRIPNEEAYSTFVLRVKDFRDTGGGIILPREATTITGFDFDIDKFFVMYKETYIDKNGKIKVAQSQNNRLIDIMYSVMSSEEMIPRFFNPANFQDIENSAYEVSLLLQGKEVKSFDENKAKLEALDNQKNFFNPATQAMYFQRNMAANKLIGIGANAVTSNDKMAFTDIETKIPIKFNGKTLTRLYSENKEVLQDKMRNLARMLSAYVDNGKTPVADYFNLNTDTVSVFNLLLRVGVDTKTAIYFLGNPVIGNIVKHIREGRSHKEAINLVKGEYDKLDYTRIQDITQEELEYSLKMESRRIEIRDLRKELRENENRTEFQNKELDNIEAEIAKAKAIKEKVLTNYATYFLIAQELDSVSIAHKFDAGWRSHNTYEKRIMLNKANSVVEEGSLKFLTPVDQMFENNLIEIFKTPVEEFVSKVSPLFVTNSKAFRGVLEAITSSISQRELRDNEYSSVRDFLFTHFFYDKRMFDTSERSNILLSTPIDVAKAKTTINNDFLRLLETPITSEDIMRIEFNNTGLQAFSQEYIRKQFKLLESQDSKLFNDIIKYSMFTSGFKFTPFTYNHLIHPSYWEREAVKFFEQIDFESSTSLNIANFVENLVRNTSGKMFTKKLAKGDDYNSIKLKKGKIEEVKVKIDENNYLTRDGIAPTWISVMHNGSYLPAKIVNKTDKFAYYEAYTNLGDGIHTFDFTNTSPIKVSERQVSEETIEESQVENSSTQSVQDLWNEFQERILAKNPNTTIEDLQAQADKRGLEWLSDYLKKCYN